MFWISTKILYILMLVCLLHISQNYWQDELERGMSSSVASNWRPNHLYVLEIFDNLQQKCLLQIFHFYIEWEDILGGQYHSHRHNLGSVNVFELSYYITLKNWDTHGSRCIMLWWATLWYIWKSTFMSTLRWYSKWSILHLNMLTLVFEFVLKIEMAISKNRTTHLYFWWYLWSHYMLPFRTHMT
jgi:hypothetical protein